MLWQVMGLLCVEKSELSRRAKRVSPNLNAIECLMSKANTWPAPEATRSEGSICLRVA